jgi:short-subunit dehydrogenase
MNPKPAVLITGASSGIGATYADRFAARGHDLVLVARSAGRLGEVASRARSVHGVAVDVVQADLSDSQAVERVSVRLADDDRIGILINNAGVALSGSFADQDPADVARLVGVNVGAVTTLAQTAARRFARSGEGAIVNISSVVGLIPEFGQTAYAASKAFVTMLSQSMAVELASKGVYVQAVLPAATATEIWTRAGTNPSQMPAMMDVGALVDSALVGFDRREPITIPVLSDAGLWDAYQNARKAMLPEFGGVVPARRYHAS